MVVMQAARLGLNVGSIGHVGSDVYGRYMDAIMQQEGIHSVMRIMPAEVHGSSLDETLLCFVLVDPQGRSVAAAAAGCSSSRVQPPGGVRCEGGGLLQGFGGGIAGRRCVRLVKRWHSAVHCAGGCLSQASSRVQELVAWGACLLTWVCALEDIIRCQASDTHTCVACGVLPAGTPLSVHMTLGPGPCWRG
jgi:hypothetical protein